MKKMSKIFILDCSIYKTTTPRSAEELLGEYFLSFSLLAVGLAGRTPIQ
jgi:hypothetical protein